MLKNGSKVRILENFYAIDNILFGKSIRKMKFENKDLVREYIANKSALLSTLIEMISLLDHKPKIQTEKLNTKKLRKFAKNSSTVARENSQKLVSTVKARIKIKNSLRESLEKNSELNVEEFVKNKIRREAFSLAIDNLLIARTISESTNYNILNEWEGRIIEDCYKSLRESLVETSMRLLYG